MKARLKGREGMALLTVLLLVAVMAAVAVLVLDDIRFSIRRTMNAETQEQAQWYAAGAESLARRQIDRLRDSPVIGALISAQVPKGSVVAPMKHTDELYVSHYNKDRGGDQGLFDKHYDGNLRFLSGSVVVRALIYLQSDATYKVVFHDSRVEKAFATYDFSMASTSAVLVLAMSMIIAVLYVRHQKARD